MSDKLESSLTNKNINNVRDAVTDIDLKESELRQAVRNRITELEQQLAARDNEILRLQARLQRIEENYEFNYNLIKERDAALHKASAEITKLHEEVAAIALQSELMNNKWHDAEQLISSLREQVQEVEADRESKLTILHDEHARELESLQTKMENERQQREQELTRREKWFNERLCECESSQGRASTTWNEERQRMEQSHQTELNRLCNELENVTRKYHEASEALHALELNKHQLVLELEAVKKENTLLHKTQLGNETERAHERSVHAEQIDSLRAEMQQATQALESALQQESSRARQLERESSKWQRELCEVQESMHRLTMQREEEQESYLQQMREHDARCLQMHHDMNKLKELHDKRNATLQADASQNTQTILSLQEVITHKEDENNNYRQSLQAAQDRYIKAEAELELCKREVARYKEDVQQSTLLSEKSNSSWSSQCQQLSESLRESNAQLHELKLTHNTKIEQLQSEALRLTRELHSSEAARRVLEDQLHLSCDVNAQTASLQTLRNENELLQRQVAELTSANEEIRSQIGHFTSELQNDPLILSARQNQQELQHVQEELLHAQNENLRLKDSLRSKDEEISRYQLDLLKLQMLQPSQKGSTLHKSKLSHESLPQCSLPLPGDVHGNKVNESDVTNTFVKKMEHMYKSLREDYEQLRAELREERRLRDKECQQELQKEQRKSSTEERKSNKDKQTSNDCSSTITSGEVIVKNKSNLSLSSSSSLSNSETTITRKRDKNVISEEMPSSKADTTNASPNEFDFATNSANGSNPIDVASEADTTSHRLLQHAKRSYSKSNYAISEEHANKNQETSNIMNEAELWRRKYFVLEHHVRALLRERDKLQRELRQCKHETATLRSEKESLIEINSLLKAQVREAYKLHTNYKTTNSSLSDHHKGNNHFIGSDKDSNVKSNTREKSFEQVLHHRTEQMEEKHNVSWEETHRKAEQEKMSLKESQSHLVNLTNDNFDAHKAHELLAAAMELLKEREANNNQSSQYENKERKPMERLSFNHANAKTSSFVEKALSRRLYEDEKEDYDSKTNNMNLNLRYKQKERNDNTCIVAPMTLHTNGEKQERENEVLTEKNKSQQRAKSITGASKVNSTLHNCNHANSNNHTERGKLIHSANAEERIPHKMNVTETEMPQASSQLRPSASPYVTSRVANLANRNKAMGKNYKPTIVRRGGQVVRHYGFE